jgi:acetyltransferase-like isoleucine patch superfamily enzyme
MIKIYLKLQWVFKRYLNKYYYLNIIKTAKSVGDGLKVNGESYINENTFLGNNVNFNGMTFNGMGKVVIGNNFHSGIKCQIITQIHNFDEGVAIPYDSTYVLKETYIENNVWLGNNVIILGGVTIGEGAIIQAGSVVVSDIPKYGIAGGHPAKVFSQRDVDHYEKLKQMKKYH